MQPPPTDTHEDVLPTDMHEDESDKDEREDEPTKDVFAYRTIGVKDTARELSCSEGQVYNMVHRGELEYIRLGRRILILTDSLRRLLNSAA